MTGDRTRKERMSFAESFAQSYHFRLLYMSSSMMYPIMGALRKRHGGPWEVREPPAAGYPLASASALQLCISDCSRVESRVYEDAGLHSIFGLHHTCQVGNHA